MFYVKFQDRHFKENQFLEIWYRKPLRVLILTRLGFLKIVFSGVSQFDSLFLFQEEQM